MKRKMVFIYVAFAYLAEYIGGDAVITFLLGWIAGTIAGYIRSTTEPSAEIPQK
jgi:hypothetical protein